MTARTIGIVSACALAVSALVALPAIAQTTTSVGVSSSPACITLTHPLSYGSRDAFSGGDVSTLQNFLRAQGYMSVTTGYFGPLTAAAVVHFQSDNGISAIGLVGPLTRAKIQQVSCGTNPTPTPQGSVSIYSITPTSGSVGMQVTIDGNGFTNDNIIHFGGGAIANVAAQPAVFSCPMMPVGDTSSCGPFTQTLTFTVPSSVGPYCAPGVACPMYMELITPGTYNVYVQNANGSSNTVTFTVTGTQQLY